MSSGGGDSTTTTSSGPPQWQQDLLEPLLAGLSSEDFQLPNQEFASDELAGFDFLRDAVGPEGGVTNTINQASGLFDRFTSEDFLDVGNDETLTTIAGNISDFGATNFMETIAPSLRGDATIAGQGAGSTKASQAEGLAAGRSARGVSDAVANLLGTAQGQRIAAQTSALGMSDELAGLQTLPGDVLGEIGAQERGLGLFNDAAPIRALVQFLQTLGMALGGEGTSSTSGSESFLQSLFGEFSLNDTLGTNF